MPLVILDKPVLLALPAHKALQGRPVISARLVLSALQGLLVLKAQPGILVQRALRDNKAPLVILVQPDPKV